MKKREIKKLNLKIIALVSIAIFFLTISVGYSYLKQQLNIYATASVTPEIEEGYIKGRSTYSYIIENSTNDDNNNVVSYVKVKILNSDNDIKNWKVGFELKNGCKSIKCNNENVSSVKYENQRVTIESKSNDGYVSIGSFLELELEITSTNENIIIENLTLNEKLASKK